MNTFDFIISIQNYVWINGIYTCCFNAFWGFKDCFEFFSCQIRVTYGVIEKHQVFCVTCWDWQEGCPTRERPTLVKKELNSFAISSAEYNDFLLIFSALGKKLVFFLYCTGYFFHYLAWSLGISLKMFWKR